MPANAAPVAIREPGPTESPHKRSDQYSAGSRSVAPLPLRERVLGRYVEYKAPEQGISVKQVEQNHTSQRCSRTDCGFTHEDNRHGEHFCCQKCGYEVNADYDGAKNIGLRYARKRTHRLRSSPKSGSGDAPVDVRINGGTLNGESHRPIAGD